MDVILAFKYEEVRLILTALECLKDQARTQEQSDKAEALHKSIESDLDDNRRPAT